MNLNEDIIDPAELLDRLEECRDVRNDLETAVEESDGEDGAEAARAALEDFDAGETEEGRDKTILESVEDELIYMKRDGECLISEGHFADYCRQLCEDIGDIPRNLPSYIENNIDWDGVADDLRIDYTEIDIDGETFLYRAS